MAPENAKVFLAEDDANLRGSARQFIERAGHNVVVEAGTLKDALGAIPQAKALGVNVAVVDANLTEKETSGDDGMTVAAALREVIPGIKIISFSTIRYPYGDDHVDKFDQAKLGTSITAL